MQLLSQTCKHLFLKSPVSIYLAEAAENRVAATSLAGVSVGQGVGGWRRGTWAPVAKGTEFISGSRGVRGFGASL